jgi:hypothetical protein
MPVWVVRTTWSEDETEATEQWEINAETGADAVRGVMPYVRFPPHHVEARLYASETDKTGQRTDLRPGQVRRLPSA